MLLISAGQAVHPQSHQAQRHGQLGLEQLQCILEDVGLLVDVFGQCHGSRAHVKVNRLELDREDPGVEVFRFQIPRE